MMLLCLILAVIWAGIATLLLFWNPLPFPDRGHRLFGVPDEQAQGTVLAILRKMGLPVMFRFRIGVTNQAVAWDGTTVIHSLDPSCRTDANLTGSGISLAAKNPLLAAEHAMERLREAGYQAEVVVGADEGLPANYLVAVNSNAFLGWIMVFRRPGWQMARVPAMERLPRYPNRNLD